MNVFVLALIIGTGLISYKGFTNSFFFRKYEFHIGSIRAGEQIRMITSGFLHADWMHFAFNMLTLYFFAPVVIQNFGEWSFLSIYFGSMIAGSLLTLYLHKEDYYYRAVGASGAVTGIIYASILLYPDMTLYLFFALPISWVYFWYWIFTLFNIRHESKKRQYWSHSSFWWCYWRLCDYPNERTHDVARKHENGGLVVNSNRGVVLFV